MRPLQRGAVNVLFASFFLVSPLSWASAEHPSLYFDSRGLESLIEQARGPRRPQYEALVRWCDSHLDQAPPEDLGTSESRHELAFSNVTAWGLAWLLTKDSRYLKKGRQWIETLLRTPTDSQGNYHIGVFAASLAHALDFFHAGLAGNERDRIRNKLVEVTEEARRRADNSWWGGVYTHHDFWIPVAGMGIAALALEGEYEDADTVLSYAAGELSRAMDMLGGNGYWPEGVADWVYCLTTPLMFFDALERRGGKDFFSHPWMQRTGRVRLLHRLPDDSYMFIGDSYRSGRYGALGSASAHLLMKLAARYRDSHLQWLALRDAEMDTLGPVRAAYDTRHAFPDMRNLDQRRVHGLPWQLLWYDPDLRPEAPDTLATVKYFPNWESALVRTGWAEDDALLFFAGGHMLGNTATRAWRDGNRKLAGGLAHTHQNAGSVYLWAGGHFLLCPPGYGGRDGRWHSTVLIDGHGQRFEPSFRPDSVLFENGDGWDCFQAELASCYPEVVDIDRFSRQAVWLSPGTLVIRDRLVTWGGNARYIRRYEWLFHTDPGILRWEYSDDRFAAVGQDNGRELLSGRIFPSNRCYTGSQAMQRPGGAMRDEAFSVTMTGRVPPEVENITVMSTVSAALPLAEATLQRDVHGSRLNLHADGETVVLFAARQDSVVLGDALPAGGKLLVLGLRPGESYEITAMGNSPPLLRASESGQFTATSAGILNIGRESP